MRQTNLSIFIPHKGCPNTCSFCNQRFISGSEKAPSPEEVTAILAAQVSFLERAHLQAEIAFFGGSFTAVDRDYRNSLLYAASQYVKEFPHLYGGIRCSTRPDCIDGEILEELKLYGMTAVELGAQSMNDGVLSANLRGHTAEDVRRASRLIKAYGMELGLQMMTGLYGDKPEYCMDTAREFAALKADTVRIYPTVILKGTMLDGLREKGLYKSFSFDETVELCADLLEFFKAENIPVIRLGLHASETVESAMTGGVYHPALGEIAESAVMRRQMEKLMDELGGSKFIIYTDKKNMSLVSGHKGINREILLNKGKTFKIKEKQGCYLEMEKIDQTR
ncbi:MAG: radical SAM protein [Firmicutes bacterium]|nr:radical SAM protein [[Eubacterium] siraeum]MCM1487036.1 radical SAM protein [Bacillota bacterium]